MRTQAVWSGKGVFHSAITQSRHLSFSFDTMTTDFCAAQCYVSRENPRFHSWPHRSSRRKPSPRNAEDPTNTRTHTHSLICSKMHHSKTPTLFFTPSKCLFWVLSKDFSPTTSFLNSPSLPLSLSDLCGQAITGCVRVPKLYLSLGSSWICFIWGNRNLRED